MRPDPVLSWEPLTLQLNNPFHLSYGTSDTRQAFWLRLAGDSGWGEGTIPPYYGISAAAMIAVWQRAARSSHPAPEHLDEVADWIAAAAGPDVPAPARAALDLAWHDHLARRQAVPLYRLLDLPAPQPLPTSLTISIAEPDEMTRLAVQAHGYGVLKIKLGSPDDEARLAAVRAVRPDARIRVDANAGWTADEAVRTLERLARYDVELVEQPVPKEDLAGLGYVQQHLPIPVMADESLQSRADLERLAELGVQAVNLKLMKAGGLGPALALLRRARQLGLRVMLGCMIETSLGTTAMAHLAGLAEWIDLDAPLLIRNDPFQGLVYDAQGAIFVPDRPGIGVLLRANTAGGAEHG